MKATNDGDHTRIPNDANIPLAKLTRYLSVQRDHNDKSKFLAQAGFTPDNHEALDSALGELIVAVKAAEKRTDEHGTLYQATGCLKGVSGVSLIVVTVWL